MNNRYLKMEHTFLQQILIQLFSTKHILVVYYILYGI